MEIIMEVLDGYRSGGLQGGRTDGRTVLVAQLLLDGNGGNDGGGRWRWPEVH